MIFLSLLVPFALMLIREKKPVYILSPMITLSCMAIAALSGREARMLTACAYVFSVIGDFFLQHKSISKNSYIYGIAGFFMAHTCFFMYALVMLRWSILTLIAAVVLLIGYGIFVIKKLHPVLDSKAMKIAVTMYMLISVAAFSAALSLNADPLSKCLYAAGIGCIIFSDTIIAFSDFLSRRKMNFLMMPTYYLCHILVAASLIL